MKNEKLKNTYKQVIKTVFYTLLRIYDKVSLDKIEISESMRKVIKIAVICFIKSADKIIVKKEDKKINLYISFVYQLISKNYINMRIGENIGNIEFDQKKLSPLKEFLNKFGIENRKYFDYFIKYNDYLLSVSKLFKQIISPLIQFDKNDIQIFCQNENFYSKYFEFIDIYCRVNEYFKDINDYQKVDDEILKGLLNFILISIDLNNSNLNLFLSVDIHKFISIHYHLGSDFFKFLKDFFVKNYLDKVTNLVSIQFIFDFI